MTEHREEIERRRAAQAPGMTDLMVTPESIPDDLGEGDPLVDPSFDEERLREQISLEREISAEHRKARSIAETQAERLRKALEEICDFNPPGPAHTRSTLIAVFAKRIAREALTTPLSSDGSRPTDAEPYWLDEVLRRNGPCPTCGTLGMLGSIEDAAALSDGSAVEDEVTAEDRAAADALFSSSDYPRAAPEQFVQAFARHRRAALSTPAGTKKLVERIEEICEGVDAFNPDMRRAGRSIIEAPEKFWKLVPEIRDALASLRSSPATPQEGGGR